MLFLLTVNPEYFQCFRISLATSTYTSGWCVPGFLKLFLSGKSVCVCMCVCVCVSAPKAMNN